MSSLYPPNFHKLSDGVICSVVERQSPSYDCELALNDIKANKASRSNSTLQHLLTDIEASTAHVKSLVNDTSQFAKRISRSCGMESSGVPAIQKFSEAQALSEHALQLRRARGRRNMARYRERFQAREDALVASVQLLNEDIKKLEIQRRLVASNIPTNTTCWNIVAEYFRLFRYAYKSPNQLFVDQVCPGPSRSDIHRQFIQSTMTADVIGQTGCGTDAVLEDYRLVSLYQPDLDCRLVNLENGFEESIVASTRVNITISTSTLQYAFPHLVNDPVKWKAFGEKLLGQKFLLCGSVVFKWDTDRQRIVSVHMQADMLTPMLQFLGNLENVASVFDNAMVTPDFSLVLDDVVLHIPADDKNERAL